MAGLHPILFAFIVLTSRLSGNSAKMEGWLTEVTCAISMINASENLFCRTMSSRALVGNMCFVILILFLLRVGCTDSHV